MRRIQSASNSGLGAFFIDLRERASRLGRQHSDGKNATGENYTATGPEVFQAPGQAHWRLGFRGCASFFALSKRILAEKTRLALYNPFTRSLMAGDMQITCSDCGQEFTFSSADQQFFQERGYSTPKALQAMPPGKEGRSRGIRPPFGSFTGNTCDLFGLWPAYDGSL